MGPLINGTRTTEKKKKNKKQNKQTNKKKQNGICTEAEIQIKGTK